MILKRKQASLGVSQIDFLVVSLILILFVFVLSGPIKTAYQAVQLKALKNSQSAIERAIQQQAISNQRSPTLEREDWRFGYPKAILHNHTNHKAGLALWFELSEQLVVIDQQSVVEGEPGWITLSVDRKSPWCLRYVEASSYSEPASIALTTNCHSLD